MEYDLIIIGSGPAGYVAAIRAGQMGKKTALIEKSKLGGMCLNWGCIPTKALLESARRFELVRTASIFGIDGIEVDKLNFNWKKARERSNKIVRRLIKGVEYLMEKNSIEVILGEAIINSENSIYVENRFLETKSIIIATGSRPGKTNLPIPGESLMEIHQMLALEELPDSVMVMGQDPHAVELAQFFKLAGKDVGLLVPNNKLLPGLDPFLSNYIRKIFRKLKIELIMGTEVKGYEEGELILAESKIKCDAVINASFREAVIPGSKIELTLEEGFLKVNDHLQTNFPTIYGIGDVNGKSTLAHAASAQGMFVVNRIGGVKEEFDFKKIPLNMYTYPEIAQVGMTESELKEEGVDYKVNEFPLTANGKALIEGETDGLIRMLSEKKYGEVIGVQIVAANATDMISEASVLMQMEGTVYDVANTIHAHPTVSEVYMESGFAAFDQPIHQ
jgi:dihydrolipoamide dehydrogenase